MNSVAPTRSVAELVAAIPSDVLAMCRRLARADKRAWVVGGCVRDLLRGGRAKDWDLATDALPEEVMEIFPRVIPTGLDHGTVTVLLNKVPYELTTLRGEGAYDDGRRPNEVRFLDDIEQDLARRDFTFNAIALDPLDEVLIDPFDGRTDLARQVLRAVGDAHERFAEDGLRLLRAARFAATLGCSIEGRTLAAMAAPRSHATFRRVSAERIHDEWMKALVAPQPSVAFALMEQTGLLSLISEELAATVGCAQGPDHAHDVWRHSLAVLDALPSDPALRLAGLLHDVGKPATRLGGDEAFAGHAEASAELTETLMRRLKFSNQDRKRCVQLVRHHHPSLGPNPSDPMVRRWVRMVGRGAMAEVLALAIADWRCKGKPHDAMVARMVALRAQAARLLDRGFALSAGDLALDGRALMNALDMPPGPQVGVLLQQLLELVTDEPERNRPEALLEAALALRAGEPALASLAAEAAEAEAT